MNPNHLKQLAMIVKQGSLTSAAEQLFVTQPTLSRSIQQLENRVGAPLLKRARYGMVPTEIGFRLAQIGERIMADAEYSEEIIRQWKSGYHNEFTIGIDPLWEFATTGKMLGHFLDEKRHVFHFRTGSAAIQLGLLQEGELDFVLAPAHLSVAQTALEREVLFRDRAGIFVGQKSRFVGNMNSVSSEQLRNEKWIIAGASAGFIGSPQESDKASAAKIAFTGSMFSVIHLLKTSDIIVQLPARLALMTGEIKPEQMISVEEQQNPRRDIALWSRSENSERPEIMRIRQLIRDFVQQLDKEASTFGLDL